MKYVAVKAAVQQANQKMETAKKALAMVREKANVAQEQKGRKGKAA